MAGASRIWEFVKSNLLRVYDVDLLGLFYDFSQQVSSFVRSTEVCSASFRRDLLLQLLNPNHTMSAVTALHAVAQLEVACPFFMSCVMSIYLSIDLSVHFLPGLLAAACCCCWVRLLYRCCCISSLHIIT